MIYIFWSAKDLKEAKQIIHLLLKKKFVACATIIPKVLSIYIWKNEIVEDEEVKVFLKSKSHFFESICSLIKENGSYEVPEVAMVLADQVSQSYNEWLSDYLN